MPAHLVRAVPMLLLGLVATAWMLARVVVSDRVDGERGTAYRRDAAIGASLAAGWLGLWSVYLCYDWTVRQSVDLGSSVHVVRFYLPALGLIALLGAWLLVQLPRWAPVVVLAVLVALGAWDYPQLAAGGHGVGEPPGGTGPGSGGPPGGQPAGPPPDGEFVAPDGTTGQPAQRP
jgi:hypothetical protein